MINRLSGWLNHPLELLQLLLLTLPGVLIGLTVHEWAHAFVADKLGDPTARNAGRLTLNPFAHLDPLGFLSLLLLGFGWAKPVPVVMRNFKHFRRDDILVSLAGVVMNFLTALLFTILCYVLAVFAPEIATDGYWQVMLGIIGTNLSLMVFNLIPIYPLDGSHVLESLCMRRWPKFCIFLRNYGRYIMLACLVFNLFAYFFGPIVSWFENWMFALARSIAQLLAF